MDPCPFVRIVIGNLALKVAESGVGAGSIATAGNFCQARIKLKGLPTQVSAVSVNSLDSDPIESRVHGCFSFKKLDFDKLVESSMGKKATGCCLKIEVCTMTVKGGGSGSSSCGWKKMKKGKLLGCVIVELDLKALETSVANNKAFVIQNGWLPVHGTGSQSQLHVNVKAEPDPRFVFHFDGEPECSPQVFQVNGNVKQPVFTCKFGFRSCGERNLRSRFVNFALVSFSLLINLLELSLFLLCYKISHMGSVFLSLIESIFA